VQSSTKKKGTSWDAAHCQPIRLEMLRPESEDQARHRAAAPGQAPRRLAAKEAHGLPDAWNVVWGPKFLDDRSFRLWLPDGNPLDLTLPLPKIVLVSGLRSSQS
jgi:hypothetical protein